MIDLVLLGCGGNVPIPNRNLSSLYINLIDFCMITAQIIAHIILVGNSTEEYTISYRYRENNVCRQSY